MLCRKGVFRNFIKFTGKQLQLCRNLFLIKLQAEACNFIKKKTLTQVFSCEFCQISQNTFFHRTPPVAAFEFSYLKLDKNLKVRPVLLFQSNFNSLLLFYLFSFYFFTEREYNSKVVFSYFTERTNSCKTLGIINWFFSYIISRWNSLDKKNTFHEG